MKRGFMTKVCSILILCFLASSVVSGQTADIEGEWVNVDSRTRGLTRLVISKSEKGWSIEAWGKCHPKDCVWGTTFLAPLGSSVEDHSSNQGFAIWKAGFATKYVTVTLGDGQMAAEIITIFCDRSGRANVRSVDAFKRAEEGALGQQKNGGSNQTSLASRNAGLYEIRRLGDRMEQDN